MSIRGVTNRLISKTERVEEACQCDCHDPKRGGLHMRACCSPPQTDVGRASLEAYNDELLFKKDNQ